MAASGKKGVKQFDYNGYPYIRRRGSTTMSENKGNMQRRHRRFLPSMIRALMKASKSRRAL